MPVEEAVIDRIEELVTESRSLRIGDSKRDYVQSTEQAASCRGWLAAALNIVQQVIPDPQDSYRRFAEKIATSASGFVINRGVGELSEVLERLLRDIQAGLISSIADSARAEVFDDFLDHAKAYLKEGHHDRAGVIAGVVCEDALRRVCSKHGIAESGNKLDSLISALARAGVLSATKAKRARAAADVRNKAAHAQWEDFDADDVRAAIDFADELILNHVEG